MSPENPAKSTAETASISTLAKTSLRQKSPETLLKQELRSLNKELKALDKVVDEFEEMEKQVGNAKETRTKINEQLDGVKDKLIILLGLE